MRFRKRFKKLKNGDQKDEDKNGHKDIVLVVRFSPDGKTLATASDDYLLTNPNADPADRQFCDGRARQ